MTHNKLWGRINLVGAHTNAFTFILNNTDTSDYTSLELAFERVYLYKGNGTTELSEDILATQTYV